MNLLAAHDPVTGTLSLEELQQLVSAVHETTERLQHTHVALQRQVGRLQGELAEANAQLRRSRTLAALGEVAAGIAHEVRNPLGSIRLDVHLLAEDLGADAPRAAVCARLLRAVDDLEAVVRDVLEFARDRSLRVARTTAGELLARAAESCEPLIRDCGVSLGVQPPETTPLALVCDAGLIVQCISNLIRNAAQAIDEAGCAERRVELSAARRRGRTPAGTLADRIVLGVRDTGPGVAPPVLERMFNPFFTTRRSGTGLGLAIVHRIVDAHGGHVAVTNSPAGGALVELCLPPEPEAPGPAPVMEDFS
jgi:signal transduction histidine kinase